MAKNTDDITLKTDIENIDCRGSVSMGLMGSMEPINFEKEVLAPINFTERIKRNSIF